MCLHSSTAKVNLFVEIALLSQRNIPGIALFEIQECNSEHDQSGLFSFRNLFP